MEFLSNPTIRENEGWKEPENAIEEEEDPCGNGHNRTPETRSWMIPFHVATGEPAMVLVHINISYGDEPLHHRLMIIESRSSSMS